MLYVFLTAALVLDTVLAAFAMTRVRAAERRMDALLDRVTTEPRLHLRPAPQPEQPRPSGQKLFISDTPEDDEHWNDTVGEPREDEAE